MLFLGGISGSLGAEVTNPLGLRLYTQEFSIQYASPADAANAQVQPTPVYGGKSWAFSARWDDNHPNNFPMREMMSKYGLKGTFYLNQSVRNFGAAEARKLCQEGCDIGGHTQTHPLLTSMSPNEMFYELLANRVEREAQTDRPINSLAFPSGRYETRADPLAIKMVTWSFIRAGYHNTPYKGFARNNSELQPYEISTGHQVVPGDHQVDVAAFDKQIQHVLNGRDNAIKETYLIHMGVHARQTGKVWDDVQAVFQKYSGRSDWWYCNMTQYAAYDRQYHNSHLEVVSRDGSKVQYRLTRPLPAESGDDVPLTVEVRNATVAAVEPKGFSCQENKEAGRVLLNLQHNPDQTNPTLIDVVDNQTNALAAANLPGLADFPDLHAWLNCKQETQELFLTIQNNGTLPLENGWVTFRLPPLFVNGIEHVAVPAVAPGEKRVVKLALGAQREESVLRDGRAYLVGEYDFRRGQDSCRIYATTRLPAATRQPVGLRDAARMVGPFAEKDIAPDTLVEASKPGAKLADPGTTADRRWFSSSVEDRLRFSAERAVVYQKDKAWKTAAGLFDNKPQCYLVAVDFTLDQDTSLQLTSEAKPLAVLLNGHVVTPGNKIEGAVKGNNRLVMMLWISDGRAVWCAFPLFVRIQPTAGNLQYTLVPPQP